MREATRKPREIITLPDHNDLLEQEKYPLKRYLNRIDRKVEDEEERRRIRRDAAQLYVEVKQEALDDLRRECKEDLRYREPWKPLKWMYNDPDIAHILDTTKFTKVYRLLLDNTLPRKKCLLLMERYGVGYIIERNTKTGVAQQRVPVLLKVLDYSRMNRELGLSEGSRTIYKYIREFCERSILRDVGKRGERGQKILAIGTWVPSGINKFRRNPFLKDTPEMRKALRKFKVRK